MQTALSLRLPGGRHARWIALVLVLACLAAWGTGARAAATPPITEYPLPISAAGPQDITSGPDGSLWVTENLANKIAKVTTTGIATEYTVPTTNANVVEVTAGPDGALWFTELSIKKIGRATTAGQITELPLTGTTGGPSSIINGPGGLWFTLPDDNAVGRITTAGVVSTFVLTTTNVDVRDLVLGPDGAIWATETSFATDAIARLNPANGQVTEYPLPDFGGTSQLAVSGGMIYFTVTQSNLIARLNPATGAVTPFPIPTADVQPTGITAGQDGNIYFTEAADGAPGLGRLEPNGTVTEWTAPTPNSSIQAVTIGPDGNLWYTGFASNKVGKVVIAFKQVFLPLIRR